MITIPMYTGLQGLHSYINHDSMMCWDERFKKAGDQLIYVSMDHIEDIDEVDVQFGDSKVPCTVYMIKKRTENANELCSETI